MSVILDINEKAIFFTGNGIDEAVKNKRFKFSLKKFGAQKINSGFEIQYHKQEKVNKLREVESFLKSFNFNVEYSDSIRNELASYIQEIDNFQEFKKEANKADPPMVLRRLTKNLKLT